MFFFHKHISNKGSAMVGLLFRAIAFASPEKLQIILIKKILNDCVQANKANTLFHHMSLRLINDSHPYLGTPPFPETRTRRERKLELVGSVANSSLARLPP
mmetsp:Transcript_14375/g.33195  ORF Transcript_14375/g.33195 Transcript_14375/m.33195 type:complete len:101 (+) Transcript_14375:733-1035(+)